MTNTVRLFYFDGAAGGVSTHSRHSNQPGLTCLWRGNVGCLGWSLQEISGNFSFNGRPKGRKEEERRQPKSCRQLGTLPWESLNDLEARCKSPHHYFTSCPTSWTSSFSIIAPIGWTSIWPVLSHSSEKWRHSSGDPDLSQALFSDWQTISSPLIGQILTCRSLSN